VEGSVVSYVRYYLGVCLEGLGKTWKGFNQNRLSFGQDLNRMPPEY